MGLVETIQKVAGIAKAAMTAELQMELLAAAQEHIRLEQENIELKRKLLEAEKRLALDEEMVFGEGVYWRKHPRETKKWDGPYCPLCKEQDGLAVHLKVADWHMVGFQGHCSKHEAFYECKGGPFWSNRAE